MRRYATILAIIGVLLHAVAGVRHAQAMVDGKLQHHQLVADLQVICEGAKAAGEQAEVPFVPVPASQESCPVCAGLVGAFALPAPEQPVLVRSVSTFDVDPTAYSRRPVSRISDLRPPARAPPHHVVDLILR